MFRLNFLGNLGMVLSEIDKPVTYWACPCFEKRNLYSLISNAFSLKYCFIIGNISIGFIDEKDKSSAYLE